MEAQRGDELEHTLGSFGGRATQLASAGLGDALVQLARSSRCEARCETVVAPVRKREAQRQQRRQRRQAAGETLGGDQHHGRGGGDQQPTGRHAPVNVDGTSVSELSVNAAANEAAIGTATIPTRSIRLAHGRPDQRWVPAGT